MLEDQPQEMLAILMFNASMALMTASQMRADDFRGAGEQARLQGQIGAFSTLAGAFTYSNRSPGSGGLTQSGNTL